MKVVFTKHLLSRLKLRGIPKSLALKVYEKRTDVLFDTTSQHFIALSKQQLFSKMRLLVVAFDKFENHIELVTLYPTTEKELQNKINSGRWQYVKS